MGTGAAVACLGLWGWWEGDIEGKSPGPSARELVLRESSSGFGNTVCVCVCVCGWERKKCKQVISGFHNISKNHFINGGLKSSSKVDN